METVWQRLSWPQVVALATLVAGVVAILVAVPTEKLTAIPWEGVAGVVAILVGGTGSALVGPLFRPRSSGTPSPVPADVRSRPTDPPPRRGEDGHARLELLVAIIVWAIGAVIAASHLSGCGASAIRIHAGVASSVGASVNEACHAVETGRAQAIADCADELTADADEACVARARGRYTEAVAGCAIAKVAHDAWADELVLAITRDSWTWADGLPLAVRMLDAMTRLVPHLEGLGLHLDLSELAGLAARGAQ